LLFDATELESFWCSTMQSSQKLSSKVLSNKVLSNLLLFATTYLFGIWTFLPISSKKLAAEPFEPFERFVRRSD